ncbi:hypothetical protein JHK82_053205 [Glycine max]|nr:hypothetical protein JHK86_053049 [Glycine max]KAG4915569.1 hypothetical protein JHK87_053126 [Glycine soja]KAG4927432.1 hypothetical protein JHK85_053918 [Glycine max]KAG5083039.1 hypothetical protein JHK84_053077 [Glycine max]KAG5085808.1 hypothetical protein JHK82_053205 [Glycine max]
MLLKSLPSTAISHIFLPPVNEQDLPHQDVSPQTKVQLAVSQSMQSFRDTLASLRASSTTPPLAALVVDAFANEALEIAKEFDLASYVYIVTSAMTLSLLLHLPTLHEEVACEYKDCVEGIRIPGCVSIQGRDLPDDFQDRSSFAYELILQRSKRFDLACGFLVNSFCEMEENVVTAFHEDGKVNVPIYLVGPVIQTGPSSESNGNSECLSWLENQMPNSVLYVSFGSVCALTQQQINELALGLELSGKKFLWVFRAPSDVDVKNDDPLKFLPHGFLERTKEQGLVITSWAPQTQILSHTSTGGFVTHCGWNSTVESIVAGVPMITWPLCAEQRMNAALVTEGLRVGLRPKFRENDGIVEKEETAKVVKNLLGDEGKGIRQRIGKLKDAAADALKEHGRSTSALFQFVTQLEN